MMMHQIWVIGTELWIYPFMAVLIVLMLVVAKYKLFRQ